MSSKPLDAADIKDAIQRHVSTLEKWGHPLKEPEDVHSLREPLTPWAAPVARSLKTLLQTLEAVENKALSQALVLLQEQTRSVAKLAAALSEVEALAAQKEVEKSDASKRLPRPLSPPYEGLSSDGQKLIHLMSALRERFSALVRQRILRARS